MAARRRASASILPMTTRATAAVMSTLTTSEAVHFSVLSIQSCWSHAIPVLTSFPRPRTRYICTSDRQSANLILCRPSVISHSSTLQFERVSSCASGGARNCCQDFAGGASSRGRLPPPPLSTTTEAGRPLATILSPLINHDYSY